MAKKNMNQLTVSGVISAINESPVAGTLQFDIDCNDVYTGREGPTCRTAVISVTLQNQLAINFAAAVTQGNRVLLSGRLTPQRSFVGASGATEYSGYEMIALTALSLGFPTDVEKDLNVFVCDGNVGKIKDLRTTGGNGGKAVNSFSLAVNDTVVSNGQQMSTTVWIEVSVFARLAEVVSQYVTKGKHVLVSGRLSPQRTYEKQDGSKGFSGYEIVGTEVYFMDARTEGASVPAGSREPLPEGGSIAWEGAA